MATNRELQETMARGVATLVYYHQSERSGSENERMVLEIQKLVEELLRLTKDLELIETSVLNPLGEELIARFGQENGDRLVREFLDTFRRMMMLSRQTNRRADDEKSRKLRVSATS